MRCQAVSLPTVVKGLLARDLWTERSPSFNRLLMLLRQDFCQTVCPLWWSTFSEEAGLCKEIGGAFCMRKVTQKSGNHPRSVAYQDLQEFDPEVGPVQATSYSQPAISWKRMADSALVR